MHLRSIDFEFILCMEITTPIFNETVIASATLQRKNLDLSVSYTIVIQRVKAMRTHEEFKVFFYKSKRASQGSRHCSARRNTWTRKVPQKYKYSSKSATEEYQAQDEHYRGKVSLPSLTGCVAMSYIRDSRGRMTCLLGQSYQVFTALLSHVTGRVNSMTKLLHLSNICASSMM